MKQNRVAIISTATVFKVMPMRNTPTQDGFHPSNAAPGTYWCAKEGDMCNCTGEITYSPELFDGYVYTVPEAEQTYKDTRRI